MPCFCIIKQALPKYFSDTKLGGIQYAGQL